MAFFDDFDKKLTSWGQGALQKGKDVTDSAKLSSMVRNLEGQRKEALIELGNARYIYCKQQGGSPRTEEQELFGRIDDLEQQIRQCGEQMQRLKGTVRCPNCYAEVPVRSTFCNVCGARMNVQSAPDNPQNVPGGFCENCGTPLEAGQMFCVNCGARVGGVYDDVVYSGEEAQPDPKESVYAERPDYAEEPDEVSCFADPAAREIEDENVAVVEMMKEIPEEMPEEVAEVSESRRLCAKCGGELNPGQKFCVFCGAKIADGE